jgi:sigma-B regulation protein RsbU (phosphoserine phosphatase)
MLSGGVGVKRETSAEREASVVPDSNASRQTSRPSAPATILVVDDDSLIRMTVRARLEKSGHRVIEAESGEEGLALTRQARPDLLLIDWMMPGMDGPTLCETIKADEALRTTHLILLTSLDRPEQLAEGLCRGADDFLSKAASPQEMIARVQSGLRSVALVRALLDTHQALETSYAQVQGQQELLESELRSAASFVTSLLPRAGRLGSRADVAMEYLPSLALGGDLFNVVEWRDNLLGLYVLDASGHGVSAALRAAALASFLRPDGLVQSMRTVDPGELLGALNARFPLSAEGEYFTLWLGTLDLKNRQLWYATAGHNGAIVLGPNHPPEILSYPSAPLGFDADPSYNTSVIHIESGARILLLSDGLYEARNAGGECWGIDRLRDTAAAHLAQPLPDLLRTVVAEARCWQQHDEFLDDAAIVGIEIE